MNEKPDIERNLAAIRDKLEKAAKENGFKAPARLVAVTKGHEKGKAVAALEAGHRVFGENRIQEAEAKWPDLKEKYSDVELHLIGPMQSNKVKNAVPLFDVIETLDRKKIARKLKKEMDSSGFNPDILIQVNTGEEPQKAGVLPDHLEDLLNYCKEIGLPLKGLMCIPPVDEEPALHFALLKKLGEKNGLRVFSMGMSQDFETAASLGATYVRVGTAVFGPRG